MKIKRGRGSFLSRQEKRSVTQLLCFSQTFNETVDNTIGEQELSFIKKMHHRYEQSKRQRVTVTNYKYVDTVDVSGTTDNRKIFFSRTEHVMTATRAGGIDQFTWEDIMILVNNSDFLNAHLTQVILNDEKTEIVLETSSPINSSPARAFIISNVEEEQGKGGKSD